MAADDGVTVDSNGVAHDNSGDGYIYSDPAAQDSQGMVQPGLLSRGETSGATSGAEIVSYGPAGAAAPKELDTSNLKADTATMKKFGGTILSVVAPLATTAREQTVGIHVSAGNFQQADAVTAGITAVVQAANKGVTGWESSVTQTGQAVVQTASSLSQGEDAAAAASKS